jgi:hypothetical protein
MHTKLKVCGTALLMSVAAINDAFANFFPPFSPPAVPEIDGSGALVAIALLVSIGAILFSRSKNR